MLLGHPKRGFSFLCTTSLYRVHGPRQLRRTWWRFHPSSIISRASLPLSSHWSRGMLRRPLSDNIYQMARFPGGSRTSCMDTHIFTLSAWKPCVNALVHWTQFFYKLSNQLSIVTPHASRHIRQRDRRRSRSTGYSWTPIRILMWISSSSLSWETSPCSTLFTCTLRTHWNK